MHVYAATLISNRDEDQEQGQHSWFLQNFVIWLCDNFCNGAITERLRMHQKPFVNGALPGPAGELTALRRTKSWIWGRGPQAQGSDTKERD